MGGPLHRRTAGTARPVIRRKSRKSQPPGVPALSHPLCPPAMPCAESFSAVSPVKRESHIGQVLVKCWSIVGQLLVNGWPLAGPLSVSYRSIIGQLLAYRLVLANYWLTIGQLLGVLGGRTPVARGGFYSADPSVDQLMIGHGN